MNGIITCCKGCMKRHPGCHATCPDYLAEKLQHDILRDKEQRKRRAESEVYETHIGAVEKGLGHKYGTWGNH